MANFDRDVKSTKKLQFDVGRGPVVFDTPYLESRKTVSVTNVSKVQLIYCLVASGYGGRLEMSERCGMLKPKQTKKIGLIMAPLKAGEEFVRREHQHLSMFVAESASKSPDIYHYWHNVSPNGDLKQLTDTAIDRGFVHIVETNGVAQSTEQDSGASQVHGGIGGGAQSTVQENGGNQGLEGNGGGVQVAKIQSSSEDRHKQSLGEPNLPSIPQARFDCEGFFIGIKVLLTAFGMVVAIWLLIVFVLSGYDCYWDSGEDSIEQCFKNKFYDRIFYKK